MLVLLKFSSLEFCPHIWAFDSYIGGRSTLGLQALDLQQQLLIRNLQYLIEHNSSSF